MTVVLDASALLAWFGDEPGGEMVEQYPHPTCSTANWAEVVQKLTARQVPIHNIRSAVVLLGLTLEPVTVEDAENAATMWQQNPHLSLGDRLCLALAHRLRTSALTTDRTWGNASPVVQMRQDAR